MKCAVCNCDLKEKSKIDDVTVQVHNDCITPSLLQEIKDTLIGFLYKKNGKLIRGFYHTPHEQL